MKKLFILIGVLLFVECKSPMKLYPDVKYYKFVKYNWDNSDTLYYVMVKSDSVNFETEIKKDEYLTILEYKNLLPSDTLKLWKSVKTREFGNTKYYARYYVNKHIVGLDTVYGIFPAKIINNYNTNDIIRISKCYITLSKDTSIVEVGSWLINGIELYKLLKIKQ